MNAHALYATASRQYQKGQYTDALEQLNALMDVQNDGKTYLLLAKVLLKLGFKSDAARAYQLAGESGGTRAEDHLAEAMKLYFESGYEDEALHIGRPLLERAKADADIAFIIATLFLKRGEKAILGLFKAPLSQSPNALHRALAFKLLTANINDAEDREAVANLFRQAPKNAVLRSAHLVFAREVNDYAEIDKYDREVEKALSLGQEDFLAGEFPFYNAMWCADERLNYKAGALGKRYPSLEVTAARRNTPHAWGDRIRIGYVSSDFWSDHATMKLLAAALLAHDRQRFDITLFCHTSTTNVDRDNGARATWGRIVEIGHLSDEEAAAAIRAENVDILVDLKGHTLESRSTIFNHQVAPVQVAWLGFPGTTVNVDLDYIVGDRHVLPNGSEDLYYEAFCRLPESYQPNDPMGRPRPKPFTRAEIALPEETFIFASFNANRKILPETIAAWAEILRRTPDSVLALMCSNPEAQTNIGRRFEALGISGSRIIFTPKVSFEQHLARIPSADLGLDTFPCNGHTTTSEQLWMGLPVLTSKGTNFASRVSESLLNAIGLPELVASDVNDYVEQAVALYENRDKISEYRRRLEENRFLMPLFDAERFCRHLEHAYEMMAERAKQGLPPALIDVPALPPRSEPFMQ